MPDSITLITALGQNLAFLVALAFLYSSAVPYLRALNPTPRSLLTGMLFSVIGIGAMLAPIPIAPGVILDARIVVVALAAVFGGFRAGLTCTVVVGLYRVSLGGAGILPALLSIISAAVLGYLFRRYDQRAVYQHRPRSFFLLGISLAASTLIWGLTLPSHLVWTILRTFAIPLTVAYPAGTVLLALLISRELRRHEAEHQLADEHNLLRTVIDNLPDMIYAKDTDHRFILANEATAAELRTSPAQLIGKNDFDFSTKEQAQRFLAEEQAIIRTGRAIINREERFIDPKDGSEHYLLVTKLPLRDHHNKTMGIVGLIRDVTQHKQAQIELRESEERFRYLLENAGDGVLVHDLDGRFLDVNEYACRMLGYSRNELLQLSVADIDITMTPEYVSRRLREFTPGVPVIDETVQRRKDGSTYPAEVRVVAVEFGEQRLCLALVHDISKRKQVEAELVEKEKLAVALSKERELSQFRSQFMSQLSHEFRTPLAINNTSTDMLERYWDKLETDRRNEHLRKIRMEVSNLGRMLDDVSLVIRAESGRLEFNPELLDLQRMSERVLDEIRTTIGAEHEFEFYSEGDTSVTADQRLLKHILINLLSNAVKYTPEGKQICFKVFREGGEAVLEVSDQGIGIAPEDQTRLFESYFRGKNVGDVNGTGLGLKIVKDCVDLHGGKIDVQSAVGEGSTFSVRLPVGVQ